MHVLHERPFDVWLAKQAGNAPKAVVCASLDQVLASGVLTAEIPTVEIRDQDPTKVIRSGDYVVVDASQGVVKIIRD